MDTIASDPSSDHVFIVTSAAALDQINSRLENIINCTGIHQKSLVCLSLFYLALLVIIVCVDCVFV